MRTYQAGWLRSDLVAGVVLAAILVPQGMAYAELAGLPRRERPLHHDCLPGGLRPHGSVQDPRARSRLVTRPLDLRRHHPARGGGRRPGDRHRPRRDAGDPRGPDRDRSRCRQARIRGRPAVERGPGRLHERPGHHHHRRAAPQAVRLLHGRRRLRGRGAGVRDELRPARRHRPRDGRGHPRRAARAAAPDAQGARRAGGRGRRHRGHRRLRLRHQHRRHPARRAPEAGRALDRRWATSCRCWSPPWASRSSR